MKYAIRDMLFAGDGCNQSISVVWHCPLCATQNTSLYDPALRTCEQCKAMFSSDPSWFFLGRCIEPKPASKQKPSGKTQRNVELYDAVLMKYTAGYSMADIGRMYGLSRERIRQILKRQGYTAKKTPEYRPRSGPDIEQFKQDYLRMLQREISQEQLCAIHGISGHVCRGLIRSLRATLPTERGSVVCSSCKQKKPYTHEFFPSMKSGRALAYRCKACVAAYSRERYARKQRERGKVVKPYAKKRSGASC